jgi:hypothetical protein
MKTLLCISVLLLFTLAAACQHSQQPNNDDFQNYAGVVISQSTELYLIRSDIPVQDNMKIFYPENLDDSFKHDSLRVRFSGKITTPPDPPSQYPTVRLSSIEAFQQ